MAVLNIRVDDRVRDQLREMADDAGVTLSEFVRDLLMEATVPVYERAVEHGDEPAPESMRLYERKTLSLLHRILGHLVPEDGSDVDGDPEYQRMRAEILESGFTGQYWYETAGYSTELSKRDCDRVSDVLQMFRVVTFSLARLAREGAPVVDELVHRLEFEGFDHNDPLEAHMASYVDFLMRDGRWAELRPQVKRNDGGNSHAVMMPTYTRMLSEYRRIMDSRERTYTSHDYELSLEELQRIANAAYFPSARRGSKADIRQLGVNDA